MSAEPPELFHSSKYPGLAGYDAEKLVTAEQEFDYWRERGETEHLILEGLSLATLPGPTLAGLKGLEIIYCNNNRLRSLPPEVSECDRLRRIDCGNNQLETLPAELGQCPMLISLDCAANQLTALPPELGQCACLKIIDCRNNRLAHVPPELGKCPGLWYLNLEGNPLAEGETTDPVELRRRWDERPHTKAAGRP